jgi:hypothetical protein
VQVRKSGRQAPERLVSQPRLILMSAPQHGHDVDPSSGPSLDPKSGDLSDKVQRPWKQTGLTKCALHVSHVQRQPRCEHERQPCALNSFATLSANLQDLVTSVDAFVP